MHATDDSARSRPADDHLQCLPLLRRAVRGVSGDGDALYLRRRRSQLSRQSLPPVRRLLHRLPVFAAARVQRQCAGFARQTAQRQLRALCLAAGARRRVRAQRPGRHAAGRGEHRRLHHRLCRLRRSGGAVLAQRRRFLQSDAAQRHGRSVRRCGAIRDCSVLVQPAGVLARHQRRRAARRLCRLRPRRSPTPCI